MKRLLRFALIALHSVVLLWSLHGLVGLASRDFPHSQRSPEGWRQHVEQISSVEELRQMSVRDDAYIRSLEKVIAGFRTRSIAALGFLSLFAVFGLGLLLRKSVA